mmetsp:Transcript_25886/g.38239  ORF Transcript_25886/g.38239 Transcript_25886/m.38239 type:complete len:157 (-) Transcript_25886:52-522(-)|eukprot:CAMPEP_0194209358 /NCGR_PEP_ID=MMETSP0156-20130528/7516_1 /TAXON_ID=33649 /ORGANISM="Thalassionema nitzschioides, Strain L26-B" /LENGTH=156 /DNA_ID=CAMNT_0038936521 /DNA_START=69 /DNA_END=539 /DNA_ORIENTATION=-
MIRFNLLRSPYYGSVRRKTSCSKSWVKFFSSSNTNTDISDFAIRQDITMPLGNGKVLQWYKQEGDVIKYDDVYVDVDTEDFSFGMAHEEEEDALLHEIVAQENDEVREGDLLCVFLKRKGSDEKKTSIENDEGELIFDSETDSFVGNDAEARKRRD